MTSGKFALLEKVNAQTHCNNSMAAAIIGDSVNYAVGKYLGPKVFFKENARFLKREYLEKTHRFYEKYGAKTIILARFVPIVRTFAPFVAGVGVMTYGKFLTYNVVGGILWVAVFVLGGDVHGDIARVAEGHRLVQSRIRTGVDAAV